MWETEAVTPLEEGKMEVDNQYLLKMCQSHFNEPVLTDFGLGRCIGYGETAVDCYIIIQALHGEISWHTCVGGYYWLDRLKGQGYVVGNSGEEWDDFYRLNKLLELNGAPKKASFQLELKPDDWEGRAPPQLRDLK